MNENNTKMKVKIFKLQSDFFLRNKSMNNGKLKEDITEIINEQYIFDIIDESPCKINTSPLKKD